MKISEYQEYATKGVRDRAALGKPDDAQTMFLEMIGELGEVLNAHKHARVWPDAGATAEEHLSEELGDLLWYVFAVCTVLGFDVEDIIKNNVNKLNARYGNVPGIQRP